ncbi:GAL4 enhancer protein [Malassezia vespertilionis]|uniref:GAL4 enhancer protein n=1 Tax=Malassezia vespertilionis TaxID=2020962 RepID=UPI0024B22D4C|nr:GAL4 enhancer protein [Malassezia vespertilionis]WFD05500.1 GAL4 enhancer protein [Malassezia vespertilionis]
MSIEEITDDVKDLKVDNIPGGEEGEVDVSDRVQSRAERKSRKSLQNIGLKHLPDIKRVTLRRARGHLYVVADPDVYKSPASDCYIVFGDVKNEDMSAFAQAQAAQQMLAADGQQGAGADGGAEPIFKPSDLTGGKRVDEEEEDDGSPIDETGVDSKDVDLVMEQVSVSRRKAVKALKENDGDLINAIMSVS